MKKIEIKTTVMLYESIDALEKEDAFLMKKAIEARGKSYAPYSNFHVGAALLLDNGAIVLGNNQENAAYPSGMCAERVAIWKAGSEYPNMNVVKLAITASSVNNPVTKPVGPCGACRQSLLEYEIKQAAPFKMLLMGEVGEVIITDSLVSLLPFSFDQSFL
ncbi:MAG: cytidine deaminase [Polaribacter sp.]